MADTPENAVPAGSEEATQVELPAPQTQSPEEEAARSDQRPPNLDERQELIAPQRRPAGPPLAEPEGRESLEDMPAPPAETPPTDPAAEPQE